MFDNSVIFSSETSSPDSPPFIVYRLMIGKKVHKSDIADYPHAEIDDVELQCPDSDHVNLFPLVFKVDESVAPVWEDAVKASQMNSVPFDCQRSAFVFTCDAMPQYSLIAPPISHIRRQYLLSSSHSSTSCQSLPQNPFTTTYHHRGHVLIKTLHGSVSLKFNTCCSPDSRPHGHCRHEAQPHQNRNPTYPESRFNVSDAGGL